MAREFIVVVEQDSEGYFVASVPALKGCHTQARTMEEMWSRVREAIELCLEDEEPNTHIVAIERIAV